MRRLRLGMIGGGPGSFIGPVHRIASRIDDEFELVAGSFSSDPARSREIGKALRLAGERVYPDWRTMMTSEAARSDERLDAIAITTPNHLHAEPAIAALDAGFHVICDKPLAATLADARAIAEAVARNHRVFGLTHNYSGYPMVREARAMVVAGALGTLRLVEVEYAQSWLSKPVELTGNRQAAWRTDPERSGAGGALGDIGTHAYHLASFVTDDRPDAILADLSSFGAGRTLDDNAHVLLRYASGARGMLWASQVAAGSVNGLRLRLFGTAGGLDWHQEQPNQLRFMPVDGPTRILERGGPGAIGSEGYRIRVPAGHPEGFLEAFGQLYADLAAQMRARDARYSADPGVLLVPGIEDGLDGMRFIAGAVASSRAGGVWIQRRHWDAPG